MSLERIVSESDEQMMVERVSKHCIEQDFGNTWYHLIKVNEVASEREQLRALLGSLMHVVLLQKTVE